MQVLDEKVAEAGMRQHHDKREVVLTAKCGIGAHKNQRAARAEQAAGGGTTEVGVLCTAAKYLWALMDANGGYHRERVARTGAAQQAYQVFWRFWRSQAQKRVRLLVYKTVVLTTLLSGVECLMLGVGDYRALTALVTKHLRALMQGEACHKERDPATRGAKYEADSNSMVLEWAGLAPMVVEVGVRWLSMLQGILRDPRHHECVLTAFFVVRCGGRCAGSVSPMATATG